MKAVAATLLLLGIIAGGCGQIGQSAPPVLPRPMLHMVTLPALPKWVLRKFRGRCREVGCARDAVAVEANGDILVAVGEADECCYFYGLVRFDPRKGRWVPGGILDAKVPGVCFGCFPAPLSFLPVGQTVWMIDGNSGSLDRGQFSNGWSTAREVIRAPGCMYGYRCPRGRPTRPWGFVTALTPAGRDRVWVVGSTGSSCLERHVAADYVCGRSLIGLAGARSTQVRPIPVSPSGTATAAAVDRRGAVWLLVPRFRRCPHGPCRRSALIRYDPARRRLTRYMIPAWLEIGKYEDGAVYTEPGGSVWVIDTVSRGLRVIRLHHGSFRSRVVRFSGAGWTFPPPMDRNGNIWFCYAGARTVNVLDPRTGQRTTLRNQLGTALLQGVHGEVWYVKGDYTGWSSC